MIKRNRKKIISLVLGFNVFTIVGCSDMAPIFPPQDVYNSNNSDVSNKLNFSKVSSEKLNEVNDIISKGLLSSNSNSGTSSSISPQASATPSAAPSGYSDIYEDDYYPVPSATPVPYYTPGYYGSSYYGSTSPFENYVLLDVEEAKEKGKAGSYLDVYNSIVKPMVLNLSNDSKLVSTFGNSDNSGNTKSAEPNSLISPVPMPTHNYMYTFYNFQWQFTFISEARKEVYSILVSPEETTIFKQRWGKQVLNLDGVKIDSTKAIEILRKKIEDKTIDDITPNSGYDYAEEIYSIPETATINYNLIQIKEEMVWDIQLINYDYNSSDYYGPGHGQINASTGELISFERLRKYKMTNPSESSYPYPYDLPTVTPTPMSSPSPSALP